METVGIRTLRQNASRVVARVAAGERVTVTDRGRAVAVLSPIVGSTLAGLVADGRARPPIASVRDLPAPFPGAPTLMEALREQRGAERF